MGVIFAPGFSGIFLPRSYAINCTQRNANNLHKKNNKKKFMKISLQWNLLQNLHILPLKKYSHCSMHCKDPECWENMIIKPTFNH